MNSGVYSRIADAYKKKSTLLFLLIDPDNTDPSSLADFIRHADASGVDGFLVGGSLSSIAQLDAFITRIKTVTKNDVIIFPGGVHHISPAADAILFLSIISGRNSDHLIGQHVIAAPIVKRIGLEAISTGYLLIESGAATTAEFMSSTRPIPRKKTEIAVAHALAGEYLGMKMIYLEAGSGAEQTVPNEMVSAVSGMIQIPLIVGGGIRSPEIAHQKVEAGATIIVIGNHFENSEHHSQIQDFAEAVHARGPKPMITV